MNKLNTTLIVPTLTRFDLLKRLLASVDKLKRKPDRIIVIDNSNGQLPDIKGVEIVKASNLGVAQSWNLGLSMCEDLAVKSDIDSNNDIAIICNDDNILKNEAIAEIEKLAIQNEDHPFFGSAGGGFSFFAMRVKKAIFTVGYFDEGFYPAYYEDNDYHYRMKLQGLDFICSDLELYELGVDGQGSQTLNSTLTPDIIRNYINAGFSSNQYRYICKWGGMPDRERFKTPFNLDNSKKL